MTQSSHSTPVTRNYTTNLTSLAYTKHLASLSQYHTFYVLDHNGECVDEFDDWQEAVDCYRNDSPPELVGLWCLYGVQMVTLN